LGLWRRDSGKNASWAKRGLKSTREEEIKDLPDATMSIINSWKSD